jgi:hypothetical protein
MKVKKPDSFTEEHAKFLAGLKGHNSLKTKKLVEHFGVSFAEATVYVMYWELSRGK